MTPPQIDATRAIHRLVDLLAIAGPSGRQSKVAATVRESSSVRAASRPGSDTTRRTNGSAADYVEKLRVLLVAAPGRQTSQIPGD